MADPIKVTDGPWAGWMNWPGDAFEVGSGPFYHRIEADGRVVCAFTAEEKHLNFSKAMHGGCLMTFADYCTFAVAHEAIAGRAVTVNLSGDFLGPAFEGDRMEGTGEVTRAGGRIIYVRGLITAAGRPCLSYTSVITRIMAKSGG